MPGSNCAFICCKTYKSRYKGLSFHKLPARGSNDAWRSELLRLINRNDPLFNPDRATICSRHYEEDCFLQFSSGGRRLKEGSLPTLHLNDDHGPESSDTRPTATMATNKSHPSATGNEKKEHGSNPIRGRICISSEFPRWQKLRESLQLRSHSEVARVLLDWYFSHQDCYRPPFPSSNLYGNLTKDNESLELSNDEAHDSLNNIDYSEYQHQKKADLFLDGQDIQVFDTTSNELVFRTSLKRPSVNHSRKNKRRNSFTVPFSRNRNYHSSSEEEEEPVADPTDPTYEPTVANETCQSRSISHRRRSNRLRNTEDEFEDTELSEDYKVEIKEEFPEKFADEGSLDDTVSEEKSL